MIQATIPAMTLFTHLLTTARRARVTFRRHHARRYSSLQGDVAGPVL